MRTERPSCLIISFDWRKVYETKDSCCCCCAASMPAPPEVTSHSPCSSSKPCCSRDGCAQRAGSQSDDPTNPARLASSRVATHDDNMRPALSIASGSESPSSVPVTTGSRTPGSCHDARTGSRGSTVAAAEAEAMATIEFFRERLQRRIVVPKIVSFAYLLHISVSNWSN